MKLSDLLPGDVAVLVKIGGEGAIRRRLLDMGLTPKTQIYVRKVAPFGDPIEIYLRGYELTLRKDEAANIEVMKEELEKCGGNCHNCNRHRQRLRGAK